MYLTRAFLNPRREGARKLLSNPHRLHAATLACFPEQPVPPPSEAGRVLWRLDPDNPYRPVLWMVSPTRPDLTHIVEDAGWPRSDTPWESRSYRSLLQRLDIGQRYAFQLTANPTYSIPSVKPEADDPMSLLESEPHKRARGKRVPHTTVSHQLDWLTRRSETAGFRILPSSAHLPGSEENALQVEVKERGTTKFSKECDKSKDCKVCKKNGKHSVTIVRATYVGALEVTDPDALRLSLCHGLGRARAYGCGLLTLAPLRRPMESGSSPQMGE